MRALLIVPRLPGTGHTGDRLRAEIHIEALARAGFVTTLLGGSGTVAFPPPAGVGKVVSVRRDLVRVLRCASRIAFEGAPFQSLLYVADWKRALEAAGPDFDLTILLLARLWPFVGRFLPGAPYVIDYVDALSAAAREAREKDPSLLRRMYWHVEAARLSRLEEQAGKQAKRLIATTSRDANVLPAGTIGIPNGVRLRELSPSRRAPVAVFTGRLAYRPNEIAIRRLIDRIWPKVVSEVPGARLLLGGADAPRWLESLPNNLGVEIESPVRDMPLFLRSARVAVAPVDLGMGTPNKVFEAFEAGTPVVGTAEVAKRARSEDGTAAPVTVAESDVDFASLLTTYLKDGEKAEAAGLDGRRFVALHANRETSIDALIGVYRSALEAT